MACGASNIRRCVAFLQRIVKKPGGEEVSFANSRGAKYFKTPERRVRSGEFPRSEPTDYLMTVMISVTETI